jgi:heme oxygenase
VDQLSPALLRLNLETREYHAVADEAWNVLRQQRVRRRDYIDQLVVTFGFESSVESALAYTPGLRSVIDLRLRARAGLIAQDLIAFGFTAQEIATLPQYGHATPFWSVVDGLGWMYVMERATLHFDALRRWLVRTLGPATPMAYLRGYEGEASAHWHRYGQVLEQVCTDEESLEQLVTAARGGFQALADWDAQTRPKVQARSAH